MEDTGGRRLRGSGSGGGRSAMERLEAAMRKAEAAVLAQDQEGMELGGHRRTRCICVWV